jgi:hypothetical protein
MKKNKYNIHINEYEYIYIPLDEGSYGLDDQIHHVYPERIRLSEVFHRLIKHGFTHEEILDNLEHIELAADRKYDKSYDCGISCTFYKRKTQEQIDKERQDAERSIDEKRRKSEENKKKREAKKKEREKILSTLTPEQLAVLRIKK